MAVTMCTIPLGVIRTFEELPPIDPHGLSQARPLGGVSGAGGGMPQREACPESASAS